MNFRRRKRAIHHAEAHADGTPPAAIVSREGIPQGEAELLHDENAINEFANHIRVMGSFAFDTEFIGEESFYPQICLVQVATFDRIALIDPLEVADLGLIWDLVTGHEVECIVHAGGQDIVSAQRFANRTAQNIIDTQVAAGLLSMPWPTSLSNTIHAIIDHRIAKGHTFTEWAERPLSPSQLSYAADDVRYLPLIWKTMKTRLEEAGRLDWVRRECAACMVSNDAFDPDGQVRRACRGLTLRPRTMTILRELVIARHDIAKLADAPPRALIPDSVLLDTARTKPTTAAELDELRGMPRPVVSSYGDRLLAAIAHGVAQPTERDADWIPQKEDAGDRMSVDALWSIITMRCIATGMAPSMLLSRSELAQWYLRRRRGSHAPLFASDDWRDEALGRWLTGFLAGEERFEIGWSGNGPSA
ncbi:MAG: HRDC domain-containing protein [Planctomycetota bacterium]|nr:HRDC domain-containing protein [Planctomycetota bacterium]